MNAEQAATPGTRLLHGGALAVAYIATARLGLQLDAVGGFATLVWAPTGIAIAALLRGGVRLWPGVALGALVANLWTGAPVPAAAGIAAGNSLEAVVAVLALRAVGFRPSLERIRDAVALVALAGLATLVSATFGVASLTVAGPIDLATAPTAWRAWWLGDLIGAIVVAPLLLVWTSPGAGVRSHRRGEAVALIAATGALAAVVLFDVLGRAVESSYLLPTPFAWAAVRFAPRGTTVLTFVVAALAIVATATGHGPFARADLAAGLLGLQAFMASLAAFGLLLAAASAERDRLVHDNLVLYESAQGAVVARERFLSLASHELRTPLTSLVLQVEAASDAIGALSPDELERHQRLAARVLGAARSTTRLTDLVDRLLDVSRLAAGRLVLERAPCELVAIARDVVDRQRAAAERAGCTITLLAADPVPGTWDASRLDQVVTNLVANALRHGAGLPVEVRVAATATGATLAVVDHGAGVRADDTTRIFGLFERATPSRSDGGLGVGLYVVREIVDAHGGRITVGAGLDGGAIFTVELPTS